MVCVPTASDLTWIEAEPLMSATVPRVVDPDLKVMNSPVGAGPAGEVTFAVKVMACPTMDGLAEDTRVVVVDMTGAALFKK